MLRADSTLPFACWPDMTHPLTDTAIQNLRSLIAFPTVSGTPNLVALHHIAAQLASTGASVEVIEDGTTGRGNLIAHFGASRVGGLMLAGHIDVVPADEHEWDADPFQAQVSGDRIIGRGAADMKGFLACVIALAGTFRVSGCPVTFVVTDDEERTFSGARHLIGQLESQNIHPMLNVVGEPTLCRVAIAHPGFSDWATTFPGLEGHSGEVAPEAGAIDAALRFMSRLRAEAQAALDQAPRINFGQITGGTARNVVAATCALNWEARVATPGQSAWLSSWLDANADLYQSNVCVAQADSFASQAGSELLDLCSSVSGSELIQVRYASEAGLYQSAGIPTIVMGPGDIAVAHRPGEFVETDQISRMLECLARLLDSMNADPSLADHRDKLLSKVVRHD